MFSINKDEFYECLKNYGMNPEVDSSVNVPFVSDLSDESIIPTKEIYAFAYLKSIYKRVHVIKKSFLCSFAGEHRSGKTLTAITMLSLWDKTFFDDMENRVCVAPEEVIEAMAKSQKKFKNSNVRGVGIVVDEAGAGSLSNLNWYDQYAKAFSGAVQMGGILCPILSFCAPQTSFINSSLRKMFNTHYQMNRFAEDHAIMKPYISSFNSIQGKAWYKFPVVRIRGEKVKLTAIKIKGCNSDLLQRYSALEIDTKHSLIEDKLQSAYKREELSKESMEEIIQKITQTPEPYFNKKNELDKEFVSYGFGLSNKDARYICKRAEMDLGEKYKELKEDNAKLRKTPKIKVKRVDSQEEIYDF